MQARDLGGLRLEEETEKDHSILTGEKETLELWRWRFGHARFESLAKLAKGKLAIEVKVGAREF